ncbi:cyclic nucleotide-binding protein [Blastocystis sp. subtype 4]|uniref:cyclic nucleotide-binding protein n=1 Tax=Blastocystis sp. subtype 4 TaxID=944170 RepID=UPI000711F0F5|nr:cyclic nucleotide-binding protein [Blastocystis sp. subtype 4]KNB43710.1 cyclic nucleotide-binding protein [Blastocystis sp. subtype 4]|eukprot:XP_014527153.1 cyclic nucleotide-binding protein [Blastocystis sp. subtype 4]
MYDNLISSCEQRGGHISLSEVIQSMVDDIKLILEKEQIDFIASHGMKMNLKGKDIIIRPVAPRDKSRFMKGIQQLSADTLFLRFLSPIRELSSSQVDYLLNVDFDDHYAFAAVVDEPSYPGMAITRYIRSFENPTEAEWAVTVVDQYQGLGLGRILLYLMNLVEVLGGFDHGIRSFSATIHPTNRRILAWMEELKATSVQTEDGIVWKFPLPMPESFMRNEEIRKKLIKIAKGEGDIPLFVAADMNRESQILLLH